MLKKIFVAGITALSALTVPAFGWFGPFGFGGCGFGFGLGFGLGCSLFGPFGLGFPFFGPFGFSPFCW